MSVLKKAEMLLPNDNIDLQKWAVVACDQFTSEKEYWTELAAYVGESPSMLNIIFPEVYLSNDNSSRIHKITQTMNSYLANKVFKKPIDGCVLCVRSTPHCAQRVGIVGLVDLEDYSFVAGESPLIRATEGTILERIPPRVAIRENCAIESPHIILLIDDMNKSVIEPIFKNVDSLKKLYDFDLNMGGGHITGYLVDDITGINSALERLLDSDTLLSKYGKEDKFLFAVGDGNHSLATAKTCWENLKRKLSKKEILTHPARYALCEIMNIYDDGLKFEPIHRVIFGCNEDFICGLEKVCIGEGTGKVVTQKTIRGVNLPKSAPQSVVDIQKYIDVQISLGNAKSVDYVHGEDSVCSIVKKHSDSVGIILNSMDKNELFKFVQANGALAKKTFSMGEAVEKRYYMECRKIKHK